MKCLKQRNIIDPRTKIFLLFLCVIAAGIVPSIKYELLLIVVICLFGIYQHEIRFSIISLFIYLIIYEVTMLLTGLKGGFQISLISFFGLIHQVYPCGMMSGIIISSTPVSE